MDALEIINGLDLELLDRQITSLHEIEVSNLTEEQSEDVTGLCNFLSSLYASLTKESELS